MSLTQWLKTGKIQTRSPSLPGLPNPADSPTLREGLTVQVANDAVETLTKSTKRKRGQYSHYDDETRAKIARYAIDSGVAKAARKFTSDLDRNVSETTVRSMRDQYVKLKKSEGRDSSTLPRSPRGAPTLLGDLDGDVQNWVRLVRLDGGVINARVVMAGAEAIVVKHAKHKLERYGGHITVTKHYARSLLRRMGFVKRKGTKNVKQLPSDFEGIKSAFVDKVSNVVKEHNIPHALVINWDQTGVRMVPGGDWTMDERGSQQVPINGLDDKRQITLVLAIARDGTLLPPQLIYPGKTERCLPKCDFPDLWDIAFTESHWSNEESMLRYVDKIIVPYVNSVRDGLPLVQSSQPAVAIFDVYKAHQSPLVLKKLKDNGITPLFVPACCTDRLQPLDVAVNYDYKEVLKSRFHDWYMQQVLQSLDCSNESARARIDLKTSTLKPIHAKWIISTHSEMENRGDLVKMGFKKAGL